MFATPVQEPIETEFLVIGSGVAGTAIAQKLAQAEKEVYILGSPYDSQIAKAGIIENSKRIPEGTNGMKWIEQALEIAKKAGAKHRSSKAIAIEEMKDYLLIRTKMVDFHAKFVIIATGAHQQSFGFKGEKEFFHKGVSDCAVCDANLFRGRKAAIIGNHKYTIKSANYISKIVKSVAVLWIGETPPTESTHYKHLIEKENTKIYLGVKQIKVYGDDVVKGIRFQSENENVELDIDVVFVEGEPQPTTDLFKNLVEVNENGHIVVNEFQTSHPQIFALGDVIQGEKTLDRAIQDAERLAKILTLT